MKALRSPGWQVAVLTLVLFVYVVASCVEGMLGS